jgi:hypothetical protein
MSVTVFEEPSFQGESENREEVVSAGAVTGE